MKGFTIVLIITVLLSGFSHQPGFVTAQKKYERVRNAYKLKYEGITSRLSREKISVNKLNILLVACKEEKMLELYARPVGNGKYKLIETYPICAASGTLGPKRVQGDGQVPEGFYRIDRFNPVSNFHLSLGLNYPNAADRKHSTAKDPGGDIFIHGNCVSIGCMAMTDDRIREIYVYAVEAKQSGQLTIPVYIFPFRMTDTLTVKYKKQYKENKELCDFWDQLKAGYDRFYNARQELNFQVNSNGNYIFK